MNTDVAVVELVERIYKKLFAKKLANKKVRYSHEPRTPKMREKTQPDCVVSMVILAG